MKKFETIVAFTLIILFSSLFLMTGCDKNENTAISTPENLIYETETKMGYNSEDQSELNSLVKKIANEKKEIEILKATIADFKDSHGSFKAISAQYRVDDELTNLVVPLTQKQDAKSGKQTMYMLDGCEMKCTSAWGCGECTQTIIERCKSQTCTCTSGNGGCSSKIIFPPPPSEQ